MGSIDIGLVVFSVAAIGGGAWMNRAQEAYLRAYAAATGTEAPTLGNMARKLTRPWQLLTSAPLTYISRATAQPQGNPQIESLRQIYLARRRITFVGVFVAFFLFSLLPHMRFTF